MSDTVFDRDRMIRSADLTCMQTFYLTTLNQFVGRNADAWPSQTTLANAMNAGLRSVRNWQQELEGMGVLQVDIGKGRSQTNRYRLDLSKLPVSDTLNEEPRAAYTELNAAPRAGVMRHHVPVNAAPRADRKNKKEQLKEHSPKSEASDLQTAEFIWDLIHEMQPTRKPPNLTNWSNAIRLMRERDGRTHKQIRDLFQKCNQDEFWCTNILSPDKLRAKWDDLTLKLVQKRSSINGVASEFATVIHPTIFRVYMPDLRNIDDVQKSLTSEQFTAAKQVGIDRIAKSRADNRTLAAEFASARKASK